MKLKILVILNLISVFVFSQEKTEQQISNEILKLKRIVQIQKEEISTLTKRNEEIEIKLNEISNNLDQKLNRNLELQAQNERAINITLDEFSQKFKEQNQTVEGVKSTLDKQLFYQIIYYSIGVFVFLIILFIGTKFGIKRALKKQEQNWNSFNEHILRQE
jgi:predicted RNase H-like nuclease (RuvC/YqgF family)